MGWSLDERTREAMRAPIGTHLVLPDTRIEERAGWYRLFTPSARDGTLNEIIVSQLDEREADAVIDGVIAEHAAIGTPFRWLVGPDATPADLGERLEARGFTRSDARAMTYDTSMPLADDTSMPLAEDTSMPIADDTSMPIADDTSVPLADRNGVEVVEVGAREIDVFSDTLARGWSLDPAKERPRHAAVLSAPDRRHHFFLAWIDGEPVGTAGLVLHPRSAYLIGGVVLPHARGRGVYRALVEARVRWAARIPRTLATTQAREATSAPILERLGWQTGCRFRMYSSPRP